MIPGASGGEILIRVLETKSTPLATGAVLKDENEITVTAPGDLRVAAIVTRGTNDSDEF